MNDRPYLLAIGGGIKFSQDNVLIKSFTHYSGDKNGIITILPTASDNGHETGKFYRDCFSNFCDDVEYHIINKRADTKSSELIERLSRSTGIFFTGGNQLKITSLMGGSNVMREIKKALDRNTIIAGTSAGASAMSDPMISWGKANIMTKGQLHLAPGIGLIQDVVLDSHFVERGRITRLLHLVALHPGILGIGLSEDTACLFDLKTESFEVIGSGSVFIVNGRDILHSNIADIEENQPFSLTNVRIDALGQGYNYNYRKFEVTIPDQNKSKAENKFWSENN